jgi:hypothetical protein
MTHDGNRDSTGVVACALSPTALTDRQSRWRALANQALSRRVGPGWISSTLPRGVGDTLEELIDAEAECCPFLAFDVRPRGEVLEVELRFPIEFEPMVSALIGGSDPADA